LANPLSVTLHASGEETASGSSAPVDIGSLRRCVELKLEVSDLQGDGAALTIGIETGPTSSGPWRSLTGFDVSAPQVQERVFGLTDRYVRATWELEGDAVTFALAGTAHVLYATPTDVAKHAMRAAAVEELPWETKLAACLSATDEADGYIASSHTMPLVAWGSDLTKHVACMAALEMLRPRGFGGSDGPDAMVVDAHDKAIAWLNRVAAGRLQPVGMIDSTPETYEGGSVVVSRPRRR